MNERTRMPPFGRVLTAMITPFTDDGAIDEDKVSRLARHLVDSGSEGIVVAGTTGESPTLSPDEKVGLFHSVRRAVGDRASVIAGTGTYDTAESVELTERAADAGVDGVLAVTPYYSKPEQRGLVQHFRAIADASQLPVMLYNIPGRTGRLIEVATIAELSEHPRIVAVKDAVMDIDHTSDVVAAAPDLVVYSGQDSYTLPMIAVGAVGVVSVVSHLAGRTVADMVDAATSGDLDRARRLHHVLLPVCAAAFLESNPGPVKGAMSELWEPVGDPRPPLSPARPATIDAIRSALGTLREATT